MESSLTHQVERQRNQASGQKKKSALGKHEDRVFSRVITIAAANISQNEAQISGLMSLWSSEPLIRRPGSPLQVLESWPSSWFCLLVRLEPQMMPSVEQQKRPMNLRWPGRWVRLI